MTSEDNKNKEAIATSTSPPVEQESIIDEKPDDNQQLEKRLLRCVPWSIGWLLLLMVTMLMILTTITANIRKLDMRLLPILCVLYLMAYLDR